jgi:integrase
MLWSAFTLAVAAMLRCGEFTVNHTSDEYLHLGALTWHNDQQGFTLTLTRDKTHETSAPIEVYMTGTHTCPVKAMRSYLNHRVSSRSTAPLFLTDEKQQLPLTRRYITEQLPTLCAAAGIEHAHDYKGHSFRRGGATSLARAGVQSYTIKKMGRWKSNAFQLYIDHSHVQLKDAAVKAATHNQSSKGKNVHDSALMRSHKR